VIGDEVILDYDTHTYTVNGQPVGLCVSDVLHESGIVKPYPESAAANVEHARMIGDLTHAWTSAIDKDIGISLARLDDSLLLGYVTGYQKFLKEIEPEWLAIEESYYRQGVAGTPDRIGRFAKDMPVIVDIKTPKCAAAHWAIQLSAYQWLTEYEASLYVCWLASDGTYKLLNYTPDLETWEAALTVAKWQRR
jgi:hypothetical protein